jgi:uncharacterized membrane protein YkvA (DUF1232 family)
MEVLTPIEDFTTNHKFGTETNKQVDSCKLPANSTKRIAVTEKWKQRCREILAQIRLVSFLMRHPDTPWYAKAIAGCALAYIVSPVQLIPNFIPVIGQLDDIFVLYGANKLLRKMTRPEVFASYSGQRCGQEKQRKNGDRPVGIPQQLTQPGNGRRFILGSDADSASLSRLLTWCFSQKTSSTIVRQH